MPGWTQPIATSSANTSASTIAEACVNISRVRLGTRSTKTPAPRVRVNIGYWTTQS